MLNHYLNKLHLEAGCDEAGRGCLAGPVVAAAVILPKTFPFEILNDSKKLTAKRRDLIRPIIEKQALAYAVSFVSEKEIDEINILNASFLAMTRAVKALKVKPDSLLIDGNRFKTDLTIPFSCEIKGDARFCSIAAASVLAKTYRDEYMERISKEHPIFDWKKNKGYPTEFHRAQIQLHGASIYHRKTFKLLTDK